MKTLAKPRPKNPALIFSIYRNIVFKLLETMTRGRLLLEDEDGSQKIFGQGTDGIEAKISVRNSRFYQKIVFYGDIGFGESFADGDWETSNLTDVVRWFILNTEDCSQISGSKKKSIFMNLISLANKALHKLKANTVSGSRKNISAHYDLSNDFFKTFLDPTMTYSCAYFNRDESLEEAQIAKYDALCRKLKLKPTDHVLEIGSGWGGFSLFAAKTYGCKITTITISHEQFKFAREKIRDAGLSERIDIRLTDYRWITGQFDKIVSIEMLEAVGDKYFETYFAKCHQVLKKGGLAGFQVITCADSRYEKIKTGVDWIQKHIFPGSLLPSLSRMNQAIARTGDLQLFDLEDLSASYVRTLQSWSLAFNRNLGRVLELGFDEHFIRKWNYYFSYCEAAFAMRHISVVQAVYTRPNNFEHCT